MKHARLALVLSTALMIGAGPSMAQDRDDGGQSLMEDGARQFWDGLQREIGPMLDALRERATEMEPQIRDFVQQMGPALAELMAKIDDLSVYAPPEMLPNGDIILRRKVPREHTEPAPADDIEI